MAFRHLERPRGRIDYLLAEAERLESQMPTTLVTKEEVKSKMCWEFQRTTNYLLTQLSPGGPWTLVPTTMGTVHTPLGTTNIDRWWKQWRRDSDFWNKVQLGLPLPDHDFYFSREKRLPARYNEETPLGKYGSTWYSRTKFHDSEWYAEWGNYPSYHPFVPSLAQLQAKLLKKQRGESWQAPVFFAEAGKTATMVKQRAGDLVRLLNFLRRGDAVGFVRGLKTSLTTYEVNHLTRAYNKDRKVNGVRSAGANLWLETWYGWVPFVSDVYDAVETLTSLYDLDKAFEGTTRATVWTGIGTKSLDGTDWGGQADRYIDKCKDSRRAVWRWATDTGWFPSKLGLTNPASIAWELLPFSFVADWFIPIGNWLDTLDAPHRVIHKGGTYGEKRVYRNVKLLRNKGTGYAKYSGVAHSECTYIKRSAMTSLPYPGIDLLKFRSKFGAWHATTSIALLTQTMGWFKK